MTDSQHKQWRELISNSFGACINNDDNFLLLIKFITASPQKYYNKRVSDSFLDVLETAFTEDVSILCSVIQLKETDLNIACKSLTDINSQEIHEMILPTVTYEKIIFIDEKIHYNLLRILEGPVYQLLHLFASYKLIKQDKKTEGIDLYNCFQVIAKTKLSFIESVFDKTVRNAIAHGKVSYGDMDITYYDKNNKKELSYKKIVSMFDALLDIANALVLGFQLFYIKNHHILSINKVELPQAIKVEELSLRCDAPRWQVKACFETLLLGERRQLTVFIKDSCLQYDRAFYQAIATAAWAESLSPGYDRYSVNITSKYAMGGHGAFNGLQLENAREARAPLNEYALALEENLFLYWPRYKLPKLIYKVINLWDIMEVVLPVYLNDYRTKVGKNDFVCKDVKWHSRGSHIVVTDASIVLVNQKNDYRDFVRQNYKKLIRVAIKQLFAEMSWLAWQRLLPVYFLRLRIYDTQLRVRDLRESGLGENLICMLVVNLTHNIKNIDIMDSVAEQHGKCRIMWNKKWLQKVGEYTEPTEE